MLPVNSFIIQFILLSFVVLASCNRKLAQFYQIFIITLAKLYMLLKSIEILRRSSNTFRVFWYNNLNGY